jgi:hypothetical protein
MMPSAMQKALSSWPASWAYQAEITSFGLIFAFIHLIKLYHSIVSISNAPKAMSLEPFGIPPTI